MRPQESPKSRSGILNGLGRLLSPRSSAEAQRRAPSADVDIARSGRYRVAPLAALAGVIGMAPGKAKADDISMSCGAESVEVSVPSGAAAGFYADGYFLYEDPVWFLEGPIYYGSTSDVAEVTDYESAEYYTLGSANGNFYAQQSVNALELSLSGTSGTATDLGFSPSYGFTEHDGVYLLSAINASTGVAAIYPSTAATYNNATAEYRDPTSTDGYKFPDSCDDGTGSNYIVMTRDEGGIADNYILVIDSTTGDQTEFAGSRATCVESTPGTLTFHYTHQGISA